MAADILFNWRKTGPIKLNALYRLWANVSSMKQKECATIFDRKGERKESAFA
jgi:hypothetical protein